MVTQENYEEYLIMYVDGELQAAQEIELKEFLAQHPELDQELISYELTKVAPDTSITFSGKAALLKPAPVKRSVNIRHWREYSIAAGIAAIIFVSWSVLFMQKRNRELANKDQPMIHEVASKKTQSMAPLNQAPISDNAKKETIKAIAAKPVHYKELTGVAGKTNRREHKTTPAAQTNVMSPLPQTNTEKVALATIKELPHESPGLMNAQEATLPYAQINKNQEHEKTFWEKLPIDELKKKEMKHLSEQAAAAYREINTVGKDTDEKALTIKIEKRKLVLSF